MKIPQILAINQSALPAVSSLDAPSLRHLLQQTACFLDAEIPGSGVIVGFINCLRQGADYSSMNYGWFAARYERL